MGSISFHQRKPLLSYKTLSRKHIKIVHASSSWYPLLIYQTSTKGWINPNCVGNWPIQQPYQADPPSPCETYPASSYTFFFSSKLSVYQISLEKASAAVVFGQFRNQLLGCDITSLSFCYRFSHYVFIIIGNMSPSRVLIFCRYCMALRRFLSISKHVNQQSFLYCIKTCKRTIPFC